MNRKTEIPEPAPGANRYYTSGLLIFVEDTDGQRFLVDRGRDLDEASWKAATFQKQENEAAAEVVTKP